MICSIAPIQSGLYRATALVNGDAFFALGISHTDALKRLWVKVWGDSAGIEGKLSPDNPIQPSGSGFQPIC